MKLDSVRALKAELFAGTGPNVASPASVAGRVARRPKPRVALGAAKPGREYALAIRLLDNSEATNQFVERATLRAKEEVDVEYVGLLRAPRKPPPAATFQKRLRPLTPGYSVGHRKVTAGTLGTFVVDDEFLYVLSNNHVLAATNVGKAGDDIFQNARLDAGGTPVRNIVGGLDRYIRLKKSGNRVDAALSWVHEDLGDEIDTRHAGKDVVGWRKSTPPPGEAVWKVGRTTGVTTGRIRTIELDGVEVDYSDAGDGSQICSFDGQMEIVGTKQFSDGGDSGSVILDDEDHAVGLLFAGNSGGVTYANPIAEVFAQLRIKGLYRR